MTRIKNLWKNKTFTFHHDPGEKPIVLMRDPSGHEGGTVAELRGALLHGGQLSEETESILRKADRWAAAADRPQFPKADPGKYHTSWSQVNFSKDPILYHPLSGDTLDLLSLQDIPLKEIKAVSLNHFTSLIMKDENSEIDWRRTFLSFWRYGPETPHAGLGALWRYLPADTRVPDHTIWDHVGLASAFAGAFSLDPEGIPALLTMSIGPVQTFISQARSVSDMWAASHLLSMTTWEAIKAVCEDIGPDSVIFPQLRGIPIVDMWLRKEMGVNPPEGYIDRLSERESDANPIFRAALPNKFTAIVPAGIAKELAEKAAGRARQWVRQHAVKAASMLLEAVEEVYNEDSVLGAQLEAQLGSFPEVHWASVPWSLVKEDSRGIVAATTELSEAMEPFYNSLNTKPGFLGSEIWNLISKQASKGAEFFPPNPGVLYPALYDLGDRLFASSKSVRPFDQHIQEGFRCSVCGEREWLTLERDHLLLSPGERKDTLWTRVAEKKPAWARKGEHLCGLCTLKRLWPSIFVEEIRKSLDISADRYVVSTHTMALATTIGAWLDRQPEDWSKNDAFNKLQAQILGARSPRAALPLSLHRKLGGAPPEVRELVQRLPSFLDERREAVRGLEEKENDQAAKLLKCVEDLAGRMMMDQQNNGKVKTKPEAYYALIMADGDNMGAWISGLDPRFSVTYGQTWHPQVRAALSDSGEAGWFAPFLDKTRPPSPARHVAVSSALNIFSLELCAMVVEDFFKGKLIYAGGDDLLAMVSIDDVLPCMFLLRLIYSGEGIESKTALSTPFVELGMNDIPMIRARRGHVLINNRLYRVMSGKASASFGAVVAHHTAPLAGVLRELRAAEHRAKDSGRDSFSISLMKRSGGKTELTLPWQLKGKNSPSARTPMETVIELRNLLGRDGMSRRAAYLTQQWAEGLPEPEMLGGIEPYKTLLKANMIHQFERQYKGKDNSPCRDTAHDVTELIGSALAEGKNGRVLLRGLLTVAEFLAREGRFTPFGNREE